MTERLYVFGALQLVAALAALRWGGWPERVVAGLTSTALVGGWFLPFEARLAADLALAIALLGVTLVADRFWPIWVTALLLVALGVHWMGQINPAIVPKIYSRLAGWVTDPIPVLLLIGIWRHVCRSRKV